MQSSHFSAFAVALTKFFRLHNRKHPVNVEAKVDTAIAPAIGRLADEDETGVPRCAKAAVERMHIRTVVDKRCSIQKVIQFRRKVLYRQEIGCIYH